MSEFDLTIRNGTVVTASEKTVADVGIKKMLVMSNPRKYHAISGFGLEIVEYVK